MARVQSKGAQAAIDLKVYLDPCVARLALPPVAGRCSALVTLHQSY